MLNLLEVVGLYDDTWKITFYFVLAVAILLGLVWTVLQVYKNDKKANKTNVIYDKSYDAIEESTNSKKSKKDNQEVVNYYDVYQTAKKTSKGDRINLDDDENKEENISNNKKTIKANNKK